MQFHPRDLSIFRNVQQHFTLVRCALQTLRRCTEGAVEAPAAFAQIQKLERDGDEIMRNAIRQIDSQLVDFPPREATRHMFYQQDRILDASEHLAGRLAAYRLDVLPEPALRFAAVVEACSGVLADAIAAFGEARHFTSEMAKISDLEDEADQLYITAIRGLAEQEGDPRRIIMLHDVYGMFEKTVNLFEDCMQAIEDLGLKTRERL